MARTPTVYWDACVWIGHINQEADKFPRTAHVLNEAAAGRLQIMTSTFCLAEVLKRRCDGEEATGIDASEDDLFAELLKEPFVTVVNADWDAGVRARDLYRRHRSHGLKKPQDALHLATAVLENVDEMHTFDGCDLLKLAGHVKRDDGITLMICKPPEPPPPEPRPGNLFDDLPVDLPA